MESLILLALLLCVLAFLRFASGAFHIAMKIGTPLIGGYLCYQALLHFFPI